MKTTTPHLLLLKGGRAKAGRRVAPESPPSGPPASVSPEASRVERFAGELRLTIVARAGRWRLTPSGTVCAVALMLGRLAAMVARGDRARLDRLLEELHRQVRDAGDQAFCVGEAP